MFERNRIDRPSDADRASGSVSITIDDGEVLEGRVYFPAGRSLGDELNNASGFLDFEFMDGDRFFLSKSAIQMVRLKNVPRVDHLARAQAKSELFNPWVVLGVAEHASKDEVREAYHRLVKQYHPDLFANMELPREVKEYLNAMSRRINAAYTTLNGGLKRDTGRDQGRDSARQEAGTSGL